MSVVWLKWLDNVILWLYGGGVNLIELRNLWRGNKDDSSASTVAVLNISTLNEGNQ